MIDFDQERNLVGIFAGDVTQHAKGGSDRVAAAFNGQFNNVFRVKIGRIGGKRGPPAVLNALVDGQNR